MAVVLEKINRIIIIIIFISQIFVQPLSFNPKLLSTTAGHSTVVGFRRAFSLMTQPVNKCVTHRSVVCGSFVQVCAPNDVFRLMLGRV